MYLGELDFTVTHRAGKLHHNADGISRSSMPPEAVDAQDEQLAQVWTAITDVTDSSSDEESVELALPQVPAR